MPRAALSRPAKISDAVPAKNTPPIGKKVGLFLQKVLRTKDDGSDTYRFELRHVFQVGTRKTYAEHSENAPAEAIAALEASMKDKDERTNNGGQQFSGNRSGTHGANPYAQNGGVQQSRLQQAAHQHNAQTQAPQFDDDIPF